MSVRRVKLPDRITYLDEVEYEAKETPGVGNYNIRVLLIRHREEHKLR